MSFSGLFDTIQPTGHTLLDTQPLRKTISRVMRTRGARKIKELMLTLNGAAAGEAALDTYSRVEHTEDAGNPAAYGGARTIETVTVINANTAAADETAIDNMLEEEFVPATYPADASSNGGGGKLNDEVGTI